MHSEDSSTTIKSSYEHMHWIKLSQPQQEMDLYP